MAKLFLDGSKLMHHLPAVNRWLRGETVYPIHVEISPTSGCNQRCILCCVDYKGHRPKNLSEALLLHLVDEFTEIGVKSVLLAGEGEPTVNPAIVPMIERARLKGLDMALNTNAVLMDKNMADRILSGLVWLRFTFQAASPALYQAIHRGGRDDFEKACRNVRYAAEVKRAKNLPVTLGMQQILINENAKEVYRLAKMAKDMGLDYFVVKRFSKHPENSYNAPEDLYKSTVDEFKRAEALSDKNFKVIIRWRNFTQDCFRTYKKCIGLSFITQILADGGIYPCCQFFNRPDLCYGSLYERSFREIWDSDRRKAIQEKIKNEVNVDKCMSYCRHHSTNLFLWQFYDKPEHVNFI